MPAKQLLSLWQMRKLSHEQCKKELVASRDPGLLRALDLVTRVEEHEQRQEREQQQQANLQRLGSILGAFKPHPSIHTWFHQYDNVDSNPAFRFQFHGLTFTLYEMSQFLNLITDLTQ